MGRIMAVEKKPCKNHPDRLTSRRCFYCKAPICSECQLHLSHHLFCSKKCYYLWKKDRFLKQFRRLKHKEVYLFFGLILIVLAVQFVYFNHRLNRLARQPVSTNSKVVRADSLWFDLDTTVARAEGRITFSIAGNPNAAVLLWHNGRLVPMPANGAKHNFLKNIPLYFGENRFVLWEYLANGKHILIDSFRVNWQSARLQFMARPLYRIPIKSKLVALTFDAGSSDRGSLNILDILRKKKIHCTMFVTGQFLRRYPDIVRQMILDGHQVGNHTFNHPHLTTYARNGKQQTLATCSRQFVIEQLLKTDTLFYHITGRHLAPFWRAPFGEFNRSILRWAAEAGFKHIGWSRHCDALDWVADSTSNLYRTAPEILNHFLQLEETSGLQGRIILMHLGTDRKKDYPYQILTALIDSLRTRGYRFVTVGQLISTRANESLAGK